jgi:hypothetical protein
MRAYSAIMTKFGQVTHGNGALSKPRKVQREATDVCNITVILC